MLDKENIWKDRFNDPTLEREDWLEPDVQLIDGVMDAIETAPRRRRMWLLWLMLGLITLVAVVSQIPLSPFGPSMESNSENQSEIQAQSPGVTLNEKAPFENAPSESVITSDQEAEADHTGKNNTSVASKSNDTDNVEKSRNQTAYPSETGSDKQDKLLTESQKQKNHIQKKVIARKESDNRLDGQPYQNKITDKPQVTATQKKNLIVNPAAIQKIKSSAVIAEGPVLEAPVMAASGMGPLNQDRQDRTKKIMLGSMFSLWDFNLNSSYETALDPADFYHNTGKSAAVVINYQQFLNDRLFYYVEAGYEKVRFNSGHNSSVAYDPALEDMQTHSTAYNLTMASPVGFINSDIVINRSSANGDQSANLTVDLNNRHSIQNLSLASGLGVQLIQHSSVGLSIHMGLGLNQFIRNNHTLVYCGVDDAGYEYSSGYVSSAPLNLVNTTLYGQTGVQLSYLLGNNWMAGLVVDYQHNMGVIYKEDDFSTQLNRYRVGLQFGKKF